ncbi:MAG: hypothetical protein PHQ32_04720 [Firmicutes bacterium]|nr:hypothetical protein [Bacillota bacterium]
MAWSKTKQNLDKFLCPELKDRVIYCASGYRYLPDKPGMSYISVDQKNIFNMKDHTTSIKWYQTEQEIKNDKSIQLPISDEDIETIRKETKKTIPEDRLAVIARNKKIIEYAKEILIAQIQLSKNDFQVVANKFLSSSIDESLDKDDILLNILALLDKRVGRRRLLNLSDKMKLKHPVVQYFYNLRCNKI